MNNLYLRIPDQLQAAIIADLRRPHEYAYERVGFCYGSSVNLSSGDWLVIINNYKPVLDYHYIRSDDVGARVNSEAIRDAFQFAYTSRLSLFHVHLHDFDSAIPTFSDVDLISGTDIVRSIAGFVPSQVHGLLLLSDGGINSMAKRPDSKEIQYVEQITSVGLKLRTFIPNSGLIGATFSERYSRQSFLGDYSELLIRSLRVGIVGLSGGGSHVVQQLAHLGFEKYVLSDPDGIDESNLNRVVGATYEDVTQKRSKFEVFQRLIRNLHLDAEILGGRLRWEDLAGELKSCDVIFGCLDTVLGRRDLENFCRRYLIEYIDIGMGIATDSIPYSMFGQVQLSAPGHQCLTCNGFITPENLKREANNYGQKTRRPQVVWPNAILASTAVGIAIDLITDWTSVARSPEYLSYCGNDHSISDHIMKTYRTDKCLHYPISESGPLTL